MSEHIALGDMVEGKKTSVIARKIIFKKMSLQKHEITKKLMVSYSMDRNCSVKVIEKISLSDEEIAYRAPYNIFWEVGDILKADAIQLCVAGIKNVLGDDVKEGVSHRHGATVVNCSSHAIARITTPWQGHLRLLDMTAKGNLKLTNNDN